MISIKTGRDSDESFINKSMSSVYKSHFFGYGICLNGHLLV